MPYPITNLQVGFRNRLSYELLFNDYNQVINSWKTDATYKITDISLEYDIVTQPKLARSIKSECDKMVLLYDRVIQHSQIPMDKLDTKWNWSFNNSCKSLKGILVLFEEEQPFIRDTNKFYNPKMEKVTITVEGKANQLYPQAMRSFEQYDQAHKYFVEGRLANEVNAQLQLHNVSVDKVNCGFWCKLPLFYHVCGAPMQWMKISDFPIYPFTNNLLPSTLYNLVFMKGHSCMP